MNEDIEMEHWRKQWQSENSEPLDLRRAVEREARLSKIGLVIRTMVTIIFSGGIAIWALRESRHDDILLACVTWAFFALAWSLSWAINRGSLCPTAFDARSFLSFVIRRCENKLMAIWFAAGFFLCVLAFCLSWTYGHSLTPKKSFFFWLFDGSISVNLVWLVVLAFFSFLGWQYQKKRSELLYFLDLQQRASESSRNVHDDQRDPLISQKWKSRIAWRLARRNGVIPKI